MEMELSTVSTAAKFNIHSVLDDFSIHPPLIPLIEI